MFSKGRFGSLRSFSSNDGNPFGPGPSPSSSLSGKYPGGPCWSCEQVFNPTNELFCNKCEKLQPLLEEQSYFELLGLKPSFFVEKEVLERKFQALQKKVHPDKYVGKSVKEQAFAIARSAAASEAYQTMKDPIARAKYILAMNGVDLESEVLRDPQLLMEIMEEQELLTENEFSSAELEGKCKSFETIVQTSMKEAEDLFQNHGENALVPITHLIVKAQFYDKICKDATELLQKSKKLKD